MPRASLRRLLDIGTVARQVRQHLRRQAPRPGGRRQHDAADIALSLLHDVDEGLAVEAQCHRPADLRVVEGRDLAVDDQGSVGVERRHLADRLRRLGLEILQERDRDIVGPGHVELAGGETEDRRRTVRDNRPFDAVEIRPVVLPVIRVALDPDRFVRLELDEFERTGADRMCAHVARRDVAGIDRRQPRGKQGEQRRLRPFQSERDREIAVRGHPFEILVPSFAGIDAEPLARLAGQEVPGALDVIGGERSAVVPLDALAERKAELFSVFAPRPASRELRHDCLQGVLRHVLVVEEKVVEHPHHRHRGRQCRFLEDRHARRAVAMIDFQDAARLLRRCGIGGAEARQQQTGCEGRTNGHLRRSPSRGRLQSCSGTNGPW